MISSDPGVEKNEGEKIESMPLVENGQKNEDDNDQMEKKNSLGTENDDPAFKDQSHGASCRDGPAPAKIHGEEEMNKAAHHHHHHHYPHSNTSEGSHRHPTKFETESHNQKLPPNIHEDYSDYTLHDPVSETLSALVLPIPSDQASSSDASPSPKAHPHHQIPVNEDYSNYSIENRLENEIAELVTSSPTNPEHGASLIMIPPNLHHQQIEEELRAQHSEEIGIHAPSSQTFSDSILLNERNEPVTSKELFGWYMFDWSNSGEYSPLFTISF